MKAASRSFYPVDKIDPVQDSALSHGWTDAQGRIAHLDGVGARKADISLKLIESLLVVTEGRRLRLYMPGVKAFNKEQAPADPCFEIRDGWRALFEYHRLSAQNETVCLSTGGSVHLGEGEMLGFDMHLELSREYCQKKQLRLRLGCAAVTLVPAGRQENCAGAAGGGHCTAPAHRGARSAFQASPGKTEGSLNEVLVYDLDNDRWITPKDTLFDLLSPTLAVSEQNVMLFRFGAAGFGEIHFYDAPMCAG
ncbi:MAG: hypothetical protein AAGU74_02485 [Bacillota bacterium]